MPYHFSTRTYVGFLFIPLYASFSWSFSFSNTPSHYRCHTTNTGFLHHQLHQYNHHHHHQQHRGLLLLFASSTDEPSRNNTNDASSSTSANSSTKTQKKTGNVVKRRPMKLPFSTGLKYLFMVSKGQHPQYQNHLQKKYNTDCYIIWDKYVTLLNGKAIRDVLESENLEKPSDVSDAMKVMFYPTGGILGAQSNEEWVRQRRMTTPGILSESITSQIQSKLQQTSKPLFKILNQAASDSSRAVILEMDTIFSALTMDTIALITLGKSFGMLDNMIVDDDSDDNSDKSLTSMKIKQQDSFTKALEIISSDAIRQSVSPRWILKVWKPSRKVRDARFVLDTFLNDCIEERLNMNTNKNTATTKDLLSILLDAESNGKITRDEAKAQLLTFIYAGYDTTAHTLSYMLYEISINQQLQDKIAKEVMELLPNYGYGDGDDDIPIFSSSLEAYDKLRLLDCAWMETLRKHPATASGPARIVGSKPILVGDGIEIPANVQINIPPYALHRNTDYWSNPEVFEINRWMTSSTTTAKEKSVRKQKSDDDDDDASNDVGLSFLPFGSGPRKCMGAKLAKLEGLYFMAGIFRRYEVTCVESSEPIPFTALTTKPRDGIRFTFEHRQ